MEKICRLAVVKGRVQGVTFRASCAREAQTVGVTGYARNLPDGNVEVLLQGTAEAVEKVLLWCHQGPPSARVDAVITQEATSRQCSHFAVL